MVKNQGNGGSLQEFTRFFKPNRVDFDGSFLHTEMVGFRCFCCTEDGAGTIFDMVVFEQNLSDVNGFDTAKQDASSSTGFRLI